MVSNNVCVEICNDVLRRLREQLEVSNLRVNTVCLRNNGRIIPTPTSYIAYRTGDFTIFNYRPGEVVIRVSTKKRNWTLFEHPHVRIYHEYLMAVWSPSNVDVNVFMPCTRKKPYRATITHKMIKFYASKLSSEKGIRIALYSISEPMLIVPYELETYYPLANYDFPPKYMKLEEKELMAKLISMILPRFLMAANFNLFILPKHHESIVREALNIISNAFNLNLVGNLKIWPYGSLAFRSFKEAFEYLEKHITATYTSVLSHLKLHK